MALTDHWRIEHAFSSGPDDALPIGGHVGAEVPTANGQGYTLRIAFDSRSDSPTGAWPDAPGRWQTVRRLGGPASATVVHELPGDGAIPYTVVGAAAGTGGGLITLYPAADSQYGSGGHFACTSIEDATTLPERLAPIDLELTRLADLGSGPDAYPDRETARVNLQAPI